MSRPSPVLDKGQSSSCATAPEASSSATCCAGTVRRFATRALASRSSLRRLVDRYGRTSRGLRRATTTSRLAANFNGAARPSKKSTAASRILVNARDIECRDCSAWKPARRRWCSGSASGLIRWLLPNRLKVVTTESAGQYFGQVKYLAGTDHFSSVKPDRLTHPSHEFLETFVRRFRQFLEARHPSPQRSPVAVAAAARQPASRTISAPIDGLGSNVRCRLLRGAAANHRRARQTVRGRAPVEETFSEVHEPPPRGYFFVTGGPDFGKTAFACHLTNTLGLIHHLTKLRRP